MNALLWRESQDVPTRTQRKFLHNSPFLSFFFVGGNSLRGQQEAVENTQEPLKGPPKRYFKCFFIDFLGPLDMKVAQKKAPRKIMRPIKVGFCDKKRA